MGGEGWEAWRGEGGRDGGKCQSRFKVRLYPSEMQEMRGKKNLPLFFRFPSSAAVHAHGPICLGSETLVTIVLTVAFVAIKEGPLEIGGKTRENWR